jgi:hypothetical protein
VLVHLGPHQSSSSSTRNETASLHQNNSEGRLADAGTADNHIAMRLRLAHPVIVSGPRRDRITTGRSDRPSELPDRGRMKLTSKVVAAPDPMADFRTLGEQCHAKRSVRAGVVHELTRLLCVLDSSGHTARSRADAQLPVKRYWTQGLDTERHPRQEAMQSPLLRRDGSPALASARKKM